MRGIHSACTRICKNSDQDVLLHIERPGVQTEFPLRPPEEDAFRYRPRHQMADGHHSYLRGDGRNGQGVLPVPEELVNEREYDAGSDAQNPHSEREHGLSGVVGFGHGQLHLFDGAFLVELLFLALNLKCLSHGNGEKTGVAFTGMFHRVPREKPISVEKHRDVHREYQSAECISRGRANRNRVGAADKGYKERESKT